MLRYAFSDETQLELFPALPRRLRAVSTPRAKCRHAPAAGAHVTRAAEEFLELATNVAPTLPPCDGHSWLGRPVQMVVVPAGDAIGVVHAAAVVLPPAFVGASD